ncbi:probable glycerol-3-phosphate dehydrogenase [NAD(+)] 2, cytosolic [Miscanthus floridulus]|uniref:probable glycerol-3-phosphate dehydrogenase [NAD(+)] 2, cytosolic n=1 Tax=Miscanthus floridulus TaxID=154761 RepID=UPI0034591076
MRAHSSAFGDRPVKLFILPTTASYPALCLRREARGEWKRRRRRSRQWVGLGQPDDHANGAAVVEEKLDALRRQLGKADGDPLRIVGVGAGAWGSVFCALLQDAYGHLRDKAQVRIWRRPGRATAEHLFDVINAREDVLRRLIRRRAYLNYVEARLGDRTLYADEILRDGFCLNMIDTPLCPLKVVTNLQEAVWDADIVVNGVPSTDTREVFGEIGRYWKERITAPIIISLAKGIEASLDPLPRIVTPTQMISNASRNAWYGQKLAKGELTLEMGDSIKGKGTIQGVSAVEAFYELLSQDSLSVMHPEANRSVAPVEMCPILKALHRILITRFSRSARRMLPSSNVRRTPWSVVVYSTTTDSPPGGHRAGNPSSGSGSGCAGAGDAWPPPSWSSTSSHASSGSAAEGCRRWWDLVGVSGSRASKKDASSDRASPPPWYWWTAGFVGDGGGEPAVASGPAALSAAVAVGGGEMFLWAEEGEGVFFFFFFFFFLPRATWTMDNFTDRFHTKRRKTNRTRME